MNATLALVLSGLLLSSYALEIVQLLGWLWIISACVLLALTVAAAVARWVILPYTDPDLHRLVTSDSPYGK